LGATSPEYRPISHGFDHWFGTASTHDHVPTLWNVSGAGPPLYRPCTALWRDDKVVGRLTNGGMDPAQQKQCNASSLPAGAPSPPVPVDSLIPSYTAEALAFIASHSAAAARPFLLVYCPDNTHVPTYASAKWRGRSRAGQYGDAVEELDDSVGAVLAALRAAPELDARTMVAFTSDNGAQGAHGKQLGSMGQLKCMKGSTWEGPCRSYAV
jgi:arylsulfatase A-like enzyme